MPLRSAQNDSGDAGARGKLIGQTLSLSATAATYVKGYLLQMGRTNSSIRVAAVRTHCMGGRGFGYSIVEDSARSGDAVVENDGVKLLVDKESMVRLNGARIDYEKSLQGGGLVVLNPNAVGKCHCGRHDLFDVQALAESGEC